MTWWFLFFVLYVNGDPTVHIESFDTFTACEDRRIEIARKPDIGKAQCVPFLE